MHRFALTAFLVASLLAAGHVHAQRSQALCKELVDALDAGTETGEPTIDGVNCVHFDGRIYASSALDGLEEDAIIGVGSVDVELDHDDLTNLPTTRVVLAPNSEAGKYFFIDWIAIVKTATTTSTGDFAGFLAPSLAVVAAPEAGGVYAGHDAIELLTHVGPNGLFQNEPYVRRYTPSSFGGRGFPSTAATPIVAAATGDAAAWATHLAAIDSSMAVRIVVRYRVIDTTDRF